MTAGRNGWCMNPLKNLCNELIFGKSTLEQWKLDFIKSVTAWDKDTAISVSIAIVDRSFVGGGEG